MRILVVILLLSCISTLKAAPPQLVGTASGYQDVADYFSQLECNIEGEGLRYEWFQNGSKILQSNQNFFLAGKKIYVFQRPVTEVLQGIYQCKASNNDGTLLGPQMVVAFTIVGKFVESEENSEIIAVTVGKELQLDCPTRTLSRNVYYHWGGRRGVTGVWFIPQQSHYMIMDDGSLLFANVKYEDIEYFNVEKNGVSCSMESKGATKRLTFSQRILLGQTKENKASFGPTIKTPLKDREVASGTEFIILRCGAVGLPTPTYWWTVTGFDGVEKTISNSEDGYALSDFNHILTIKSIGVKHDGIYKCKVKSTYGGMEHVDEVNGRVSVKGKPSWVPEGQLSKATPTEGDSFTWYCSARANPDPSYTWLLNGEKLSNTETRTITDGQITFQKIAKTDEGLYQCVAENNFGSISSAAVLQPLPAPETCKISKMNLMFLVDGSGSVPSATFKEYKIFMKLLVKRLDVGPNATHVSVLQYSSKSRTGLEFAFGEYETMSSLQDALSRIVYHYGAYTFGGYAMRMAKEVMAAYNHRKGAKNVMVLLMDDFLWDKRLAKKQSKALKKKGTQIIMLDTSPVTHNLAHLGLLFTTEKLKENVDQVAQKICE